MAKKFFTSFLYSLLGLCILFWLGGYLLPSEYHVEESTVIQAPVEDVFAQVVHLDRWINWSPWASMDPSVKMEYGKNMQNLQYMKWDGPVMGMGRLDIEKIEPNLKIQTKLRFYTPNDAMSNGQWIFVENGGATTVTWSNYGALEDLLSKWYGIVLKRSMRKDFQKGLSNLKEFVEKKA